jgi:hypothetical protein
MTYNYNKLTLTLEEDEVFMLWDIIQFALDYDNENNKSKLINGKRDFANRLADILDELK